MFTTPEYVQAVTGYTVTVEQVTMAQGLVETLIGRVEAVVTDANDRAILGNAVAYQAAYMRDNPKVVFEQAAVKAVRTGESTVSFDVDQGAPWYAPLAVEACKRLSWRKSRSVRTGPMFNRTRLSSWETE